LIYKEIQQTKFKKIFCEFIFVNNGSKDKTRKEIKKLIKKNKNFQIKTINLKKNQGYGGGIMAGLKVAMGKYIGWTHADLQTPIEDIFKIYEKCKSINHVFGKGSRTNNRGFDGIISRLHEKLASLILGYKMKEINAQPKIINKMDLKFFDKAPKEWTCIDTYFYYVSLKKKFKIVETNVIFKNRIYGYSKWKNNYSSFFKHIINNFLYLIILKFS
jgi:glycosyltransferase involved in cell wall biosynthesis